MKILLRLAVPVFERMIQVASTRMETLDQLRKRAGLQVRELTQLADISESSYRKMVRGEPVGEVLVYRVLRVLSERLRREITLDDVSGLNIL
jgi:hypothetical protein